MIACQCGVTVHGKPAHAGWERTIGRQSLPRLAWRDPWAREWFGIVVCFKLTLAVPGLEQRFRAAWSSRFGSKGYLRILHEPADSAAALAAGRAFEFRGTELGL